MRPAVDRRGLPVMTAGVAVRADRRFKRPDVRPARRRRLGQLAWRAARVLLVLAAIIGVGAWIARLAFNTRLLAVRHLVVRGNAQMSADDVRGLLEGLTGTNILRVDFADYRRRLMDSPWVADATLWRVLPSTVGVQIVERVPMAIARVGQQLYLVDARGAIIDEYGPRYKDFDLPIVDGLVRPPSGANAAPVNAAAAALTASYVEALRHEPDLRQRVSIVDVRDARDVVVLLNDGPTLVHLGDGKFVERLRLYLDLEPQLAAQFTEVDSVDFRYAERVPAPGAEADPSGPLTVVVKAKGRNRETVKIGK